MGIGLLGLCRGADARNGGLRRGRQPGSARPDTNLAGFQKDEFIIPRHSRNVYDAALRAVGARVVESARWRSSSRFGPRTALVYILAGPDADASPISLEAIAPHTKDRGVPMLVDAAAES